LHILAHQSPLPTNFQRKASSDGHFLKIMLNFELSISEQGTTSLQNASPYGEAARRGYYEFYLTLINKNGSRGLGAVDWHDELHLSRPDWLSSSRGREWIQFHLHRADYT
jgi:hypothetical protein